MEADDERQKTLMLLWEAVMECGVQVALQIVFIFGNYCTDNNLAEDRQGETNSEEFSLPNTAIVFSIVTSILLMLVDIIMTG